MSERQTGSGRIEVKTEEVTEMSETIFLEAADASRVLGVTPQRIRQLAREGRLHPAARTVRGGFLFAEDEVRRLERERRAILKGER